MQQVLLSIHDVMPHTLERVEQLLEVVAGRGITKLALLVVPGFSWNAGQVDLLRRWQDAGYQLAAHGWKHRCDHINGWRHRLHSWVISRDVAEHLAAGPAQSIKILHRCAQWFNDQRLATPVLYVPPAWAFGPLPPDFTDAIPFPLVETQTGIFHTQTRRRWLLPLMGFESDTTFRSIGLRCTNAANWTIARCTNRPLRLALHPGDLQLRLQHDVLRCLSRQIEAIDYTDLPLAAPAEISDAGHLEASDCGQ